MNMFDVFRKGIMSLFKNHIPLNTTRNMDDVSSSSPLTNSNGTDIKKIRSLFRKILG